MSARRVQGSLLDPSLSMCANNVASAAREIHVLLKGFLQVRHMYGQQNPFGFWSRAGALGSRRLKESMCTDINKHSCSTMM
jgi:hypothetical protein